MPQTLWQRLMKGPEVAEFKYTNPAKAKIGTLFALDVIGMRGVVFTLSEMFEYKRTINKKDFYFTDYVLQGQVPFPRRLRFVPMETPDAVLTHNILILEKYDELVFNKELDKALRDTTGELCITDNVTNAEERYWRLNGLTTPYQATLSVLKDDNKNGVVEDNEIETRQVEYWDYSRMTEDEAKQAYQQYLFVELDKDCGMQTMWRGVEIDSQRVTIL